jgi:hypothetical protein
MAGVAEIAICDSVEKPIIILKNSTEPFANNDWRNAVPSVSVRKPFRNLFWYRVTGPDFLLN